MSEWYNWKKVINKLMNYFEIKSNLTDAKATEPTKNVPLKRKK